MRISALAQETGVPVPTLKYYLREGLLQPGESASRTQASYDRSHVERVRLVRALTEVGGLSIAATKEVLTAISDPDAERLRVLGTAHRSLPTGDSAVPESSRAARWVGSRGWKVLPGDPLIDQLERVWRACDEAGLGVDEARLSAYAGAVEEIARIDVDAVPDEPADAVRQVVLGTVLLDPLLSALRRLAQQHESVTRYASEGAAYPASGKGNWPKMRRPSRVGRSLAAECRRQA